MAGPPPPNHAHPAPVPTHDAPPIGYRLLDGIGGVDGDGLVALFARTAVDAGCAVSSDASGVTDVAAIIERHGISTAVVTEEPAVAPVADALRAAGVAVGDATDRRGAAEADLGVTSCHRAVAVTGSVLVGSDVPGARWASLLPRVHLCVVPAAVVVATPGDVLRGLGSGSPSLPANLCFVTGPSRTGDIEQLLTRGVHGPVAVEVLIVEAGGDRSGHAEPHR